MFLVFIVLYFIILFMKTKKVENMSQDHFGCDGLGKQKAEFAWTILMYLEEFSKHQPFFNELIGKLGKGRMRTELQRMIPKKSQTNKIRQTINNIERRMEACPDFNPEDMSPISNQV